MPSVYRISSSWSLAHATHRDCRLVRWSLQDLCVVPRGCRPLAVLCDRTDVFDFVAFDQSMSNFVSVRCCIARRHAWVIKRSVEDDVHTCEGSSQYGSGVDAFGSISRFTNRPSWKSKNKRMPHPRYLRILLGKSSSASPKYVITTVTASPCNDTEHLNIRIANCRR